VTIFVKISVVLSWEWRFGGFCGLAEVDIVFIFSYISDIWPERKLVARDVLCTSTPPRNFRMHLGRIQGLKGLLGEENYEKESEGLFVD
jgi:hypothetical protein